jgi:hypothetical protein
MLLPLGAVAVAAGMLDTVVPPTVVALREALAVRAALARLAGTEDLTVRRGEVGRALQGFWRQGGAEIAPGGHGSRPCLRAVRRA